MRGRPSKHTLSYFWAGHGVAATSRVCGEAHNTDETQGRSSGCECRNGIIMVLSGRRHHVGARRKAGRSGGNAQSGTSIHAPPPAMRRSIMTWPTWTPPHTRQHPRPGGVCKVVGHHLTRRHPPSVEGYASATQAQRKRRGEGAEESRDDLRFVAWHEG